MSHDRIITLIDMDCFYCQVEVRANTSLKGKPVAVVQYNAWKGGGIIAVNYEARALGVFRGMRGDEALLKCPEIQLVSVPEIRGKADLTRYRNAGREVIAVLCSFSSFVEKASVDEAYVDLTDIVKKQEEKVSNNQLINTFVVGYDTDKNGTNQWLNEIYEGGVNDASLKNLARGAAIVEEIRNAIFTKTGFQCSAGISHNKILAKLACGINKPNRQTVLPSPSVSMLFSTLPLKKIRSLGGKLGDSVLEQLGITYMGEVIKFSLNDLQRRFGEKNGLWLYNMARGINYEPVTPRLVSKSIGCCKNFRGPSALVTKKDVEHWLNELTAEIVDRIQDDLVLNRRKATSFVLSLHQEISDNLKPISRTFSCSSYEQEDIRRSAYKVLSKYNNAPIDSPGWSPALLFLGLAACKFIDVRDKSILTFFQSAGKKISNEDSKVCPISGPEAQTSNSMTIVSNVSENKKRNGIVISSNTTATNNSITDNQTSFESMRADHVDYSSSFFVKYFAGKVIRTSSDVDNVNSSTEKTTTASSNDDSGTNISNNSNSVLEEPSTTANNLCTTECAPIASILNDIKKSYIDEEELSNDAHVSEICAECNQPIKLVEFLEHLDHHLATKLQQQYDCGSSTTGDIISNQSVDLLSIANTTKANSTTSVKCIKRKQRKNTNQSPSKRPSIPITNYFQVKLQEKINSNNQ